MRSDSRARRWRLLERLEARRRGASATELATALGVSVRTVYRDLSALEAAGLPLSHEREGAITRWRLAPPPTAGPSLTEALAVQAAAAAGDPKAPHAAALEAAAARLRRTLPGIAGPEVTAALAPPPEGDAEADAGDRLEPLVEALRTGRVLELTYQGLGHRRPVPLAVHALALRRHVHGLLLVAEDAEGTPRALRVDRIRGIVLGEARRPPPVEHDLEARYRDTLNVFAGGPPLALRLEASPDAAAVLAARPIHATQHLDRRPDGSALVELTVTDTPELRGFLRAFGPAVTVLAPDHLARDLAAEAAAVHAAYARRFGLERPGRRPPRRRGRGPGAGRDEPRHGEARHGPAGRGAAGPGGSDSEPDPDA